MRARVMLRGTDVKCVSTSLGMLRDLWKYLAQIHESRCPGASEAQNAHLQVDTGVGKRMPAVYIA